MRPAAEILFVPGVFPGVSGVFKDLLETNEPVYK